MRISDWSSDVCSSDFPCVEDCLVVGVPDERFGQRVTAILALIAGQTMTVSELDAFARKSLAGYKIPRRIIVVDAVQRAPNGKPDYRWARAIAEAAERSPAGSDGQAAS